MEWQPIAKARDAFPRAPNLADYDEARRDFNWDRARALLSGLPGGALNIAHEAVFRHAEGAAADRVAIRFLAQGAAPRPCTYRELAADARRVANVLTGLGVQRGERVATLMGRIPPLYATVLGTLAAGAVYCPMFSAFGPEPVKARLSLGSARVLVTTDLLYRRKVAPIRARAARAAARARGAHARRRRAARGHARLRGAARGGARELRDRAHLARGLRAAALHQRHHGPAEGRAARARRRHRPSRHRALGARPAGRRRLLVHRGPRLGHRHLLRRDRAARLRRHDAGGPRGVRRGALVRHPRGARASPSGTRRPRRSAC